MMAAAIAQANSRAYALADLSLAATVMLGTGDAVSVVGVLPASDDTERLSKAATTVLDVAQASDTPKAIVGRLARAEPLESAANAYGQAMQRQPLVEGWTRNMDADPMPVVPVVVARGPNLAQKPPVSTSQGLCLHPEARPRKGHPINGTHPKA